jgi:two-component system, LytTR family, sensor kinase
MAREKLNDKWFRFAGIPFIAFLGHIIFYNRNESGEERFGFWTIYFLSVAETMIVWEVNRLVFLYYRNRFPGLQQTKGRIMHAFVTSMVVTVIVRGLNIFLYDETRFWGYRFPIEAYLHSVAVALLFVIVVGGVYEATYYFRKWKDMTVQAEALKKENLQTQFDSLKGQINPHFLFNSLGHYRHLLKKILNRHRPLLMKWHRYIAIFCKAMKKGL